jgi:hypothetical protein
LNALERAEFNKILAEVILEEFESKLRHDIPGANGEAKESWKKYQSAIRSVWSGTTFSGSTPVDIGIRSTAEPDLGGVDILEKQPA